MFSSHNYYVIINYSIINGKACDHIITGQRCFQKKSSLFCSYWWKANTQKTAARTTPKQNNSFKTNKNTGITDLWYIMLSLTILIKIRDILFSSKYRLHVPGRNAAKRWFRWAPTLYVLGKRKKSPSNQLFPWRWSVVGAQCMDMFTKRWIAFMLSSYEILYYRFPLITVYVRPPRTYDPKQTNLIFNITYTECTTLSDSFLCDFWV